MHNLWKTSRVADPKYPIKRIDVVDGVVTVLYVVVLMGTAKVLAIRFHQHGLAQAWLTLF